MLYALLTDRKSVVQRTVRSRNAAQKIFYSLEQPKATEYTEVGGARYVQPTGFAYIVLTMAGGMVHDISFDYGDRLEPKIFPIFWEF
jgi:hypothetical protein